MQVELPPVEMIGIEREIVILSTVAGVGQNVTATFGEAKENMSGIINVKQWLTAWHMINLPTVCSGHGRNQPALVLGL